jgi:hypothetical protein
VLLMPQLLWYGSTIVAVWERFYFCVPLSWLKFEVEKY